MSQAILAEEDRLFRDTVRSWIDAEISKGWGYSTATLNNERLVNAAFCLGMLDGVLEDALEHLQTRRAFGHVIGEFQALQHYVADIAMWQKQGELMLLDGARRQSAGQSSKTFDLHIGAVLCPGVGFQQRQSLRVCFDSQIEKRQGHLFLQLMGDACGKKPVVALWVEKLCECVGLQFRPPVGAGDAKAGVIGVLHYSVHGRHGSRLESALQSWVGVVPRRRRSANTLCRLRGQLEN